MLTVATAAFLMPLVLSWTMTRWLIRIAPQLGLIDRPGPRKVHTCITPLGGGLAIFVAVALTMGIVVLTAVIVQRVPAIASWLPETVRTHAAGVIRQSGLLATIMAAATIQAAVGFADDVRRGGLSYQLRLGVEVILVVALVTQGVRVSVFTTQWWISAPVTVLWIVGLTNALNFLDNMDGLCGGVTFLSAAFFAAIAALIGDLFVAGSFFVLMGAVGGFLWFNWSPARIFMGDAGSNFIGFWLGVVTVVGTFHREEFSHITIVAPFCILAVPIYDSTSVIVLRLLQGHSPFHPDKQHFSHRLVELGFQPRNAVLLIYLVTLTTGLSGVLLYFLDSQTSWPAATLVILQVVCLLGVIALLEVVAFWRTNTRASEGSPRAAGD